MTSNNGQAVKIGLVALFLLVLIVGGFYFEFNKGGARADVAAIEKELADCRADKAVFDSSCGLTSEKEASGDQTIADKKSTPSETEGGVPNAASEKGFLLSPEQAAKKAVDYVNKNMLQDGILASAKDVSDESGIYIFKLAVQGKDYDGYVTKDGKLFFADGIPQAIKLDDPANPNNNSKPAETKKTARPDIRIFVMSYCPYGLQAQKMYLPVYSLLKDKASMTVNFVDYAMHGKKEVDENLRQYCIQKEQGGKFEAYLKCFVEDTQYSSCTTGDCAADFSKCLDNAAIDKAKLGACMARTDSQYGVSADYNDKSKWVSGQFPKFAVDSELNQKYGVQGSPTIVINGIETTIGSRTPQKLLEVVCASFANPPAECQTKLSNEQPSSGFGSGTTSASSGGCGN